MIAVTEKKIYYSSFMGHFKVGYDDLRNNLLNKEEASQQTRGCDEERFMKMLAATMRKEGGWTNVIMVLTPVSDKNALVKKIE